MTPEEEKILLFINVSMKDYVDVQIKHLQENIDDRFEAMDIASRKDDLLISAKFDAVNHTKDLLKDLTLLSFPRSEHDIYRIKTDAEIADLRESRAESKGKASQSSVSLGYFFTALTFGLALATLIHSFMIK